MRLVWAVIPSIIIVSMIGIIGISNVDAQCCMGPPPYSTTLTMSHIPKLGEIAHVTLQVSNYDVPHGYRGDYERHDSWSIIALPEGFELVSGELRKKSYWKMGEQIEHKITVKAIKVGNWEIRGGVEYNRGSDELHLVVREDDAYLHEERFPGTAILMPKYRYEHIENELKIEKMNTSRPSSLNGQLIFQITPENILCQNNNVLVFHPNDSPACVKPETADKLIERGWRIDDNYHQKNLQRCTSHKCIIISVDDVKYKLDGDAYQKYLDMIYVSDPLHNLRLHAEFLPNEMPYLITVSGNSTAVQNILAVYNIYDQHDRSWQSNETVSGKIDKKNLDQFLEEYDFSRLKNEDVRVYALDGKHNTYSYDKFNFLTCQQALLLIQQQDDFLENEKSKLISLQSGVHMIDSPFNEINLPDNLSSSMLERNDEKPDTLEEMLDRARENKIIQNIVHYCA
jgi:hypothetical protein